MEIVSVMTNYPLASIAVISFVVTLISTLAHKWLTNQDHLKHLKQRQKELQKELRKTKDEKILKELNAEMLNLTGIMFKSSMKPLFVTFIPLIILFTFLKGFYGGEVPLLSGWIWYYIGFSLISSIILRKVFDVA